MAADLSAASLVDALAALGTPVRMGSLFEAAKAHTGLSLAEVEQLLEHPAYEPRMAAFCILDFKARRTLDDAGRAGLYDLYLRRHDRISTWDMVDRSAPRVVGQYLAGRDKQPLHALAATDDPLRRRTAITAPLFYARYGPDDDLTACFPIAATLARDPDPIVHKPVGIFLKHACSRDEPAVLAFLDEHASEMPRPAVRLAIEKLAPDLRARY